MSNPAPNVVVSFSRDALVTFLDKDIQLDKSPEKIDENVFLFKGPWDRDWETTTFGAGLDIR